MSTGHIVILGVGLGVVAVGFGLLLFHALLDINPCEDHAAAADAGGCPWCGCMRPAIRKPNGLFLCPDCSLDVKTSTRISCHKCGAYIAGPQLPHQAAHHRLSTCRGCETRLTATVETQCPFGS